MIVFFKNMHQMSHPIKSVVFDLDGVLIDSRLTMEISWGLIQEKYSIVEPFAEYFKQSTKLLLKTVENTPKT